jgi:hypothetical protein
VLNFIHPIFDGSVRLAIIGAFRPKSVFSLIHIPEFFYPDIDHSPIQNGQDDYYRYL